MPKESRLVICRAQNVTVEYAVDLAEYQLRIGYLGDDDVHHCASRLDALVFFHAQCIKFCLLIPSTAAVMLASDLLKAAGESVIVTTPPTFH